jgi:hypothetical protein
VVSEFVLIDPAITFVVEAVCASMRVVAMLVEVARVALKSVVVSEEKMPVTPRMIEAKKDVVVACEPVALTKVKFWRVDDASERIPPVAVVRPVTDRVEPMVAAPVIVAEPTVAFPATESVPVAMRLVARSCVETVEDETLSDPVMTELPRVRVLPRTSKMLPVVEVAEVPIKTTFEVSET